MDYALAAGAKRLALFHHDPQRDDAALDQLVDACRRRAAGSSLDVFAAAEGQVVEVASGGFEAAGPERQVAPAVQAGISPVGTPTILIADDDPTIVRLLTLTLEPQGFRVLTASDGEAALRLARAERPALVLLDWQMPGADGIAVTRALRADLDPDLRDVPVVIITGQTGGENTAVGFEAGVTDYLTKPFQPSHVRTRVRTWLLRRGTGARAGR